MKKNLFFLTLLYLIVVGCAKIAAPTGGTKDITPPELLKTIPQNGSTEFSDNRIEFSFDEFIVLKNINKELLISPPFKTKPSITIHGKKIHIKLKDTLLENTTYIFNFGNAIADFNEGNIFKNFTYAFSTGSYIDSMQIAGQVVNAFSLKSEEKESVVLLYDYFNDTVPRKVLPRYVTRTDKSGFFHFTFLKPQNYYIFALNEINDNYLFDLPSEKIAFLDSVIIPTCQTIPDTVSDSLIVQKTIFQPDSLKLLLFAEKQRTQYISDYKRLTPYHCQIIFFAPNPTLPTIHLLEADSFALEASEKKDTLQLWLPNDTNLTHNDTLTFIFGYSFLSDSGEVSVNDTLYFKFKQPYTPKPLSFSVINKFPMPENQKVIINFSEPVLRFDTSKIKLISSSETTTDTLPFYVEKLDSLGKKFLIKNNWDYGKSFKISFDTTAIFSVYNHCNDSIGINITIQDPDYYGIIHCKINTNKKNLIFQLLDANNIKLREINKFPDDSLIVFKKINPGIYRLKVFIDENSNGEWDTGNFEELKQPENVFFFQKAIEVKSGWKIEYEWEIK